MQLRNFPSQSVPGGLGLRHPPAQPVYHLPLNAPPLLRRSFLHAPKLPRQQPDVLARRHPVAPRNGLAQGEIQFDQPLAGRRP